MRRDEQAVTVPAPPRLAGTKCDQHGDQQTEGENGDEWVDGWSLHGKFADFLGG